MLFVLESMGRRLRLLSLLQSGREWSGTDLAERVGCSTRTIRRDVDRLRELGYPIDASRGLAGYRLAAGSQLPPLLLDDDEAVAVVIGLRTAAARHVTGLEETAEQALVKLERLLPSRLRHRVSAFAAVSVPEPAPGPTVDPEILTVLATACRDHQRLHLAYTDHDGSTTRRLVEPHRLVHTGRRWYLVAYDRSRGDWRTFRVDRVEEGAPGGGFEPRDIPGGDAAAFVIAGVTSRLWRHTARVRLHAPASDVVPSLPAATGTLVPDDDSSCLLTLGGDSVQRLAGDLCGLGVGFDIEEAPQDLPAELEAVASRINASLGTKASPGSAP